jgi:hypothetical protein
MQHPTIIPAQPGYFVITKEHGGTGHWPDPILAWAVRDTPAGAVYVNPITLDDGERDDPCAILRPDGRVSQGLGESVWDTLADWLKEAP